MKASLKGLGNIKGLLLAHGEKVGIAVVGICAVMFVYSSLSHEPLPDQYQAARLRTEVDQSQRAVQEFTWTSATPEDVRKAQPLAQGENSNVQPESYAISANGWDRPVVRPTVLRMDPELLEVEDVEVYSGSGLLAFQDPDLAEQRRLEEEQAKQEDAKRMEEERKRNDDETRPGRPARGRNQADRDAVPIDPKHPNRRPVDSGVPPAGVLLTGVERVETAYWAVVVAKVPIRQQLKLYRNVLENARGYDPQYDVPKYMGYKVQRAEVVPGQPLKWQPVGVYNGSRQGAQLSPVVLGAALDTVTKEWAGSPPEVVDERFFDPQFILPFPLPPLVERDWGDDATHSDIPLIVDDEGLDAVEEEGVTDPAEVPAGENEADMWSPNEAQREGRGGRSVEGRGGSREDSAGRGGSGYAGGRAGRGGRQGVAGRGGRGETSGRSMGRGGRGDRSGSGLVARDVSYWLLRFFDFSVQPGKKYKYRVQLAMMDVNSVSSGAQGNAISKDDLDQTVLSRLSKPEGPNGVRFTDWSEPSLTVGIPLAGDVRVAGAKAPNENLYNDEPRLNLLVLSFGLGEDSQAIQAAKERDGFRRGSVANMTDDVEILVEGGEFIDEFKSFDFRTGVTVVDIRGGDRLNRDLATPAVALLMDPTGQLYVRREKKDLNEVEHHRELFAKPDTKGNRRLDGGGRGGPFDAGGRR